MAVVDSVEQQIQQARERRRLSRNECPKCGEPLMVRVAGEFSCPECPRCGWEGEVVSEAES